jgi:serine/threonine protein kinase
MWGLGMTLFEMATGKPFYVDGLTDLEYIKDRLRNPEEMISDLHSKLLSVNPQARSVIKQCLMIDPRARISCRDLLRKPYFTQNKFAIISSSNFGIPKTAAQNQLQTRQVQYEQEDVGAQRIDLVGQVAELENQLKLSDVSSHQLREEVSATKSEFKGLLDGASPIVNAAKKSASMADFAEHEVVNQGGTSGLLDAQPEVTAHLQQHDILQHAQNENEKLQNGTEQQDPNPPTLQTLSFSDRLKSVLDVINTCAMHDPDVARDLLSILDQSQNGFSPRMAL